jgi:hypothetical protein
MLKDGFQVVFGVKSRIRKKLLLFYLQSLNPIDPEPSHFLAGVTITNYIRMSHEQIGVYLPVTVSIATSCVVSHAHRFAMATGILQFMPDVRVKVCLCSRSEGTDALELVGVSLTR